MTDWRDWTVAETAAWIRLPVASDDKYSRGVLGVLTGSAEYPGAAVLGVEGAARTGLGMIRYLGDAAAAQLVLQRRPEIVTGSGRVQAWLLGSGMDASKRTGQLAGQLAEALGQGLPMVLDAGALDLLDSATGPTVLTPHFRELARLLSARGETVSPDDIAELPAHWARAAADQLGVVVLLKGSTTYVAAPYGEGIRVPAGPPWVATAGAGDVLGGVLGALLASHSDRILETPELLAELAAAAAHLHGLAGARASAGGPIVALDIAEALPFTVAELLAS
jgi:hydroxyethylthiazole kinase-like uncharacterized protein yjeF